VARVCRDALQPGEMPWRRRGTTVRRRGFTSAAIAHMPNFTGGPHQPLPGRAGDDPDMFLTHDARGATGVSGFISYDFCRLAGRVPRSSFTFLFQGDSIRCFVSSSIDLGSRLR
jgi:hypothetical protein